MKITDPHHSNRVFLIEKGAVRPVARAALGWREGTSTCWTVVGGLSSSVKVLPRAAQRSMVIATYCR